jgi:hypothetical protein
MYRTNTRSVALIKPDRPRLLPAVALNMGGLALVLLGIRLHGHWFIRIVRHSPAQTIMIAGEMSCQPLWSGAHEEEESDALTQNLRATAY